MESKRLILCPQMPVRMRYTEWWPYVFERNLKDAFDEIIVIGTSIPVNPPPVGHFTNATQAIRYELSQIDDLISLPLREDDTLLHMDLSYPGIFHNFLFHLKLPKTYVFCHASARNRYDVFAPNRIEKWGVERYTARLYKKVLVASKYHLKKLGLTNAVSLGALPNPPSNILPEIDEGEKHMIGTACRITPQKVDQALEEEVKKATGEKIVRHKFLDWEAYYQFLDRTKFLLVTSKEETYGYQIVDAMLRGCIPIAPRAYSYPELLPDAYLYNPSIPAVQKAEQIAWIMKKLENQKAKPLKNDNNIQDFWTNLKKELTT